MFILVVLMRRVKLLILIYFYLVALYSYSQESNFDVADTTIYLNEVVVSAYQINTLQHRVPGSISVLSGQEIMTSDGNNFANTLHTIPGIYMHSGTYATSRIIIRGVGSRTPYNTNRIKSYLNDIPITSSDGISTPEDIDLMGIGRMEVIKGPASALYGSGLGGNINLYTPKSNKNGGEALIQYGSFNTYKASAAGNYNNDNLSLWGNISHLQSDGFRENNRFKRSSLISSGIWQKQSYSLEYTILLLDLNAQIPSSIGKTLYENNPSAAASNWKEVEGFKEYKRAIAGITLTNRFSQRVSNKLTLYGRWADSYERRPFNNLDDGTSGGGLRNKLTFYSMHWDALIGFEWMNDSYKWQMDLDNELINRNRETRNHYNLFGMVYWRPAADWNFSLGGAINRINYKLLDLFPDNGDQSGTRNFPAILSPRFGVNYAPSSRFALFASVGHGFSMPSPEETLLPEGDINAELLPEQGVQYEVGVRLNMFNNTQLEASAYRIDLNNLLVTKRITEDIFTGINAGKTRHTGVELMLKHEIINYVTFPGQLNMNANYTWSLNKFIDFTDNEVVYDGNELPGIPSDIMQVGFEWKPVYSLNINSQLQYIGSQFIDDANSLKNSDYMLVNLQISYVLKISKAGYINFFAGVNNVSNTKYSPMLTVNALAFGSAEPRYYYPGMPRHYYTGIKWEF